MNLASWEIAPARSSDPNEARTMPDYMPAEDNAFRTWAESFAAGISNNPGLYMEGIRG